MKSAFSFVVSLYQPCYNFGLLGRRFRFTLFEFVTNTLSEIRFCSFLSLSRNFRINCVNCESTATLSDILL